VLSQICCECCALSVRDLSFVSVVCCQSSVCCECCVLSVRDLSVMGVVFCQRSVVIVVCCQLEICLS
jgi:hypothetical protein